MRTAVLAALLALSSNLYAETPDLTGWWGFTPEGCNDEDNQYRVALGQWESTDKGIVFGKGTEAIGMYDETCQLKNRQDSQDTISYSASCQGEEGETQGTAKITLVDKEHLKLFTPNGNPDGITLVRCSTTIEPTTSPAPPVKLTKEQQELIDNSWNYFTSRLFTGLQAYDQYCTTMAMDKGYWREVGEAKRNQAIQLCAQTLAQKHEEAHKKYNSETNPTFENCREYTIYRGNDWLKADNNMAVNPFEQPENEVVNFYGVLRTVGDALYVMNNKQQKVFIQKDANATLIRPDLLNIGSSIRGFGTVTATVDATTIQDEKIKVKMVNAACIEPDRLVFPPKP
jgi:hypothetical protein